MGFKKLFSGTRLYAIALIASVAILLVITILAYRQIIRFQESSDLVAQTMEVDKQLNRFFSHVTMIRSAEQDYLLNHDPSSLEFSKDYEDETFDALGELCRLTLDNPIQQKNVDELTRLTNIFLGDVDAEIKAHEEKIKDLKDIKNSKSNAALSLDEIKKLKDLMIGEEERALAEREADYKSRVSVTPLATFGALLFSLLIFVLGFWRIMQNRRRVLRTQVFLDNVLQSTSNVVDHFTPIRDEKGKIYDFEITYTNERITEATGLLPLEIRNKHISEVHPYLFENGMFEIFVDCIENDKSMVTERTYDFLGEKKTFRTTVVKYMDGVTLTSRNNTAEKQAAEKLVNLNSTLKIQNESLNQAEIMAGIGSYRYNRSTGEVTISDNFYRLLGHKPDSFEMTFEKYLTYLHPEDKEPFQADLLKSFEEKDGRDQAYRIITNDGKIKDLRSIGSFVKEGNQDILVGVVQDITEENRRKRHLIEHNIALKRSNEELESFNHVASHDLQEPLRKIETFVSMVRESGTLIADDRAIFKKIEYAAGRMRNLIKNLLAYSEISKSHENFEEVDLNQVLGKVQEDQSRRIDAMGAKVSIDKLPIVKGVPYQMEQLFNNLISNALKYGKKEGQNKILVRSATIHRSQLPHKTHKQFKNYHKISVIDNGIGFDQEQANKIFGLFQRLHQKNVYSGTGIGLAICRKIVENHYGSITAKGVKNMGATFSIYLPV